MPILPITIELIDLSDIGTFLLAIHQIFTWIESYMILSLGCLVLQWLHFFFGGTIMYLCKNFKFLVTNKP